VIGLSRRVRVFAYTRPVDMRKQYDGLYALVVAELKADPLSGDLFLFTNRRRTRAKVLLWDGTGLCLYQRLAQPLDVRLLGQVQQRWEPPA
jgi:transposase